MSMTERGADTGYSDARVSAPTNEGYRAADPGDAHRFRSLRETKPSFFTTEFWAMVAGIAALIVLYNVTDNPDLTLWRLCLLCTIGASAYIVSRGWAKSGSHSDHWDRSSRR